MLIGHAQASVGHDGAVTEGGRVSEEQRVDFFVSCIGAEVAWAERDRLDPGKKAGHGTSCSPRVSARGPVSFWTSRCPPAQRSRADSHLGVVPPPGPRRFQDAGAFVAHPAGTKRRLVPVRVADCQPKALPSGVVYVDLLGLDEPEARRRPPVRVVGERARPADAPFGCLVPMGPVVTPCPSAPRLARPDR